MPRPEGVPRETFQRNLKSLFSFVPVTHWFVGISHRVPCCKYWFDMFADAQFKYIVLSYNNEGLMSIDTIKQIMSKYGKYQVFQKEYSRFRADKAENRNHLADTTTEYLHVLIKE